jgi:hypothetical protein
MKTMILPAASLVLCLALAAGCAKKQPPIWESIKNPETATKLKSFIVEKEVQAKAVTNTDAPDFTAYFAAAERGDWLAVSNTFQEFRNRTGQYKSISKTEARLPEATWRSVLETWGALDAFGEGDEKYSALYAKDIIESIPPGSIYLGGTEPGELLITAMQKNQAAGDSFFIVAEHGLADAMYLDYLNAMDGGKIYALSAKDLQSCSQDYTNDAARRLQNHQLKFGEDVTNVNGRLQISGYTAILEVRARMGKFIFDQNSNRDFYVEESFPYEWMYPYLEPHGLIMKLDHQPPTELSDEIIQRDHDYWTRAISPMIGGWLNDDTPISEIAAFADKVYGRHDFSGFAGDPEFVLNAYSRRMFSKERESIAGLYAWRARHANGAAGRERMNRAADYAFRQAWALWPDSPEVVVQYVAFLTNQNRKADALAVAEAVSNLPEMKGPNGGQIRGLVESLLEMQQHQ